MDKADQEIRVREVFLHLLHRWRSILLVMILGAVVLGGWQFLYVNAAHRTGNLTKEEQRYERDLAYYQETLENCEQNLKDWSKRLKDRYTKRDNSLVMKLDPENTWAAEKKYLVSGAGDAAADVKAVYTGAMEKDHDAAALEEAFGTTVAGYVKDITVICGVDGEDAFLVTVYAADREAAEKGLAYVDLKIEEAGTQAQDIAPHTLLVAAAGTSKASFPQEFADMQYAMYEDVAKYEAKVRSASKAVFNSEESIPVKPGDPVVRWAFAGAVLGLLAMILTYVTSFARRKEADSGQ